MPDNLTISDVDGEYLKVDEQTAIKFPYNDSMCDYLCSNLIQMVMFIKGDNVYKIAQSFIKNSANPYPSVLDEVVSSIKFKE